MLDMLTQSSVVLALGIIHRRSMHNNMNEKLPSSAYELRLGVVCFIIVAQHCEGDEVQHQPTHIALYISYLIPHGPPMDDGLVSDGRECLMRMHHGDALPH